MTKDRAYTVEAFVVILTYRTLECILTALTLYSQLLIYVLHESQL